MKSRILITIVLLLGYLSMAQDKLAFSYDTAGNQILRNRVCLTCLKAVLPDVLDSVPIVDEEATLEGFGTFRMIAFPNPVTDMLQVEWDEHPDKKPVKLLLFTLEGRKVTETALSGNRGLVEVEFSRHPSGGYLMLVLYENGTKESFKIIKNR